MIWYNMRYLKIIEWPIEDSLLLIEGEYSHGLFSDHYSGICGHSGNFMKSVFSGMNDE